MLKTRWPWLLLAAVLLVGFCGWAAVRVRSSDWYVAETPAFSPGQYRDNAAMLKREH